MDSLECKVGEESIDSENLSGRERNTWTDWIPGLRSRGELTDAEREQMERLAFSYGRSAESYDVMISSGSCLWTPDGNGVLSVLSQGKYWHIPGGILAPPEDRTRIVEQLKNVARENRVTILLFCVGPEEVGMFHDAGYEVSKIGEEPVLDLGRIDWKGKEFDWIRRQTSYCRRHGLEVVELVDPAERTAVADELMGVLHEDLQGRTYTHPMRLLEGEFDPHRLYRRRLFLARIRETHRIAGFLACSPMEAGCAWAFETYRKRKDAPRGTMPFLFREVIDRMQAEGIRTISLCLVPGKGVERDPSPSSYWLVRWGLRTWYSRLNFLFNSVGQNHFKSRFRPRYQDRYACITPRSSPISVLSFLSVSGGLTPHIGNTLRNLAKSMRS